MEITQKTAEQLPIPPTQNEAERERERARESQRERNRESETSRKKNVAIVEQVEEREYREAERKENDEACRLRRDEGMRLVWKDLKNGKDKHAFFKCPFRPGQCTLVPEPNKAEPSPVSTLLPRSLKTDIRQIHC